MGRDTKISWCNHSFSPWYGCTQISDGCDNCYAARWGARSGLVKWNGPPRRASIESWRQPRKWNTAAEQDGGRHFVFTSALSDVFDPLADPEWRADLWNLIRECRALFWLVLTKRPENILEMLPPDWGNGYPNVGMGVTTENQKAASHRIPLLLKATARLHFISAEPLLGPVRLLSHWVRFASPSGKSHPDAYLDRRIGWIIAGGENGGQYRARVPHPDWFRALRDIAISSNIPFHFKGYGAFEPVPRLQHLPGAPQMTGEGDWLVARDGRRHRLDPGLGCPFEGEGTAMRHTKRNQIELDDVIHQDLPDV